MNVNMHVSEKSVFQPTLADVTTWTKFETIRHRCWLHMRNAVWTEDGRCVLESIDVWFDDEASIDKMMVALQEIKDKRKKELCHADDLVDAIESIASVC